MEIFSKLNVPTPLILSTAVTNSYILAISQRIKLKFCMMTLYVERIKSRVKRVTHSFDKE